MIAQIWQRLRRDGAAMFGLSLVAALTIFAIVAPWLSGDPNTSDFTVTRSPTGAPPGPSWKHPFGVDPLHRDVLARLAAGAQVSLGIAAAATAMVIAIGTTLGLSAAIGARTRWSFVDGFVMRLVDVALALPYLLLITAIGVAIDRADLLTVTLVLGLTGWAGVARLVRARALGVVDEDFVLASRALGAGSIHLVRRHLLPAVAPTLLVVGSHTAGQMILAEAVLGYLTVGLDPPQATWGRMLHEAETYLAVAPWLIAAPGLAILLAVLGFTRLGDGLRDALGARGSQPPRRRLRFLVDVSIVAVVIAIVALAEPEGLSAPAASLPTEVPQRGGTLRVASSVTIHALDPALAYSETAGAISDLVFATLVTWDRQGELVGDLAERFSIEDAGKRVVFELREGLRFHDGSPLTAADVKRSLERTLHPATPSPGASLYAGIAGADRFAAAPSLGLSGIQVPDESTVIIELGAPDASFLARMGLPFAAPVCPGARTPADPKRPEGVCGAGPFQLSSLVPGERVELRRFEDAHRPAYLDRIVWELGVPARTQRFRFERGELDLISELSGVDAFRFAHDPAFEGLRAWEVKAVTSFIFLNTQREPFADPHLRKAVYYGVDPSVLPSIRADVIPTSRVLPPDFPGPAREPPLRVHDRTRALEEMRLAGYPYDPIEGAGGYPEVIDYLTVPDTFEQASAEIFQQQLAKVGLKIRLRLVAFATWLTLISRPNEVAMGWRGWGADYPDPSTFFEPILTSEALRGEGTQNVSFFSHAPLDRVVKAARRSSSWSERMDLFGEAERIVSEQAPVVPVYTNRSLHLHQPWVRGYEPHPVIALRLREVWLANGGTPP